MSEHNSQILIDLILRRRSVRSGFTSQKVPPEIINQILECGINAPSSKNAQPWKLHVVTNVELLRKIADQVEHSKRVEEFVPWSPKTGKPRPEYRSSVVESAEILGSAPLAIFIENRGPFADRRDDVQAALVRTEGAYSLIGLTLEYIGLGAAVENMLLATQALGVRGVFMGDVLIAEGFIRVALGMKGDLVGTIALGYSDGDPEPKIVNRDNVVRHERS